MKRKLFKYLYKVHGANLLDSELDEVINIIKPYKEDQQLLDHFAGLAMQGIITSQFESMPDDQIAEFSYYIAEAMLKERERRN